MQNPVIIPFGEINLQVRPDVTHKWLLETKLVAEAYGVSVETIRYHKAIHKSELCDNEHFVEIKVQHTVSTGVGKTNACEKSNKTTFWTKEGVTMLGFFIKSDRAKEFRKFASNLIVNGTPTSVAPALPKKSSTLLNYL